MERPDQRWGIFIDIEGFSKLWGQDDLGLRALTHLTRLVFKVGSLAFPNEPERLFAHQGGDAFYIASDFPEPNLDRCAAVAIVLMRGMLEEGFVARAALASGAIADYAGCRPPEVRAARSLPAVGNGTRYAVWGHSQGGQAALYAGLMSQSYAPELRLAGIAAAAPGTLDLTGRTSLWDIAPLARGACFAVGNDTGPMHMIGPTGCKSLVLFSGAGKPHKHAPLGANVKALQQEDIADITAGEVIAAVGMF